jgi:kinetochore protein Spc25
MHAAISALQAQKQDHVARRTQLQHEIAATQTQIRQRREAQAAHQRALDAQARHNLPELRFWETCLGLRIEGAGADDGGERLRFCFEGLSGREDGKDAWFEIDTGARDFEVVGTRPRLEAEEVEAVVERANETKELNGLLKGMRGLLIDALRG